MRKVLKFFGFAFTTFVLFIAVVLAAFYYLVQIGELRRFLVREIERETGLRVELGQARVELGWITGASFRDLALFEAGGPRPILTAAELTARVALAPLLHRQLDFYEIRIDRPAGVLVREKDGRVPLIDKLLNLPFLAQGDARLRLDLRSIKVSGGDLKLVDLRRGSGQEILLHDVQLTLERLRSRTEASRAEPRTGVAGSRPPVRGGVAFSVASGVSSGNWRTALRANGRVIATEDAADLRKAYWQGELQLADLPAGMVREQLGERFSIRSIDGFLSPRLRFEGTPATRLLVKGTVPFRRLSIEAPDWFRGPLAPGSGTAEIDVSWQPWDLHVTDFSLRSNELRLRFRGEVRSLDSENPRLRFAATVARTPFVVLRKYLPAARWAPEVERVVAAIEEGEVSIKSATGSGTLSELSGGGKAYPWDRVSLEAEFAGVGGQLTPWSPLPFRRVRGSLKAEKGLLSVAGVGGEYGQSRLVQANGWYGLSPPASGAFAFQVQAVIDLAELKEVVPPDRLPGRLASALASIRQIAGSATVSAGVKKAARGAVEWEGDVALDRARLRAGDVSLAELRGSVRLAPAEIRAEKISALLDGSPVQIRLGLHEYTAPNGSFDLVIASGGVRAEVVSRLLDLGDPARSSGLVRGFVRYRGPLTGTENRRFSGELDLANVQLMTRPLLQPLRELNGKVRIEEAGIEVENLKGLLAGFPVTFSGRWRYREEPRLLFDFAAPNLDLGYLFAQIDPESSEFYAKLRASGRIRLGRGRLKAFEFSDFSSDVVIDRRVWKLDRVTMRAASGAIEGTVTVADRPDVLAFSIDSRLQAVPVQTLLRWLEIENAEMTGKAHVKGSLESIGKDGAERKRNLNGAFHLRIEDGTIQRFRILIQILNLLDLSRWFTLKLPDLTKQGIRFRSITGDFRVEKGVYTTQNLVVDSDDLRMTGSGKIDVPNDNIDFVMAVRPFAGIDTAISSIPLIGRGIAAIKNSFLVASFNINGPIDDPTITPAPLSTLSEVFFSVLGVPKKLIPFIGEENKGTPAGAEPGGPREEARPPAAP
ncbi:MAG TPA: AsmA-like C-terminal domain-containing protein [candidate division Zixibacteria bacterium]|nr:AsmA-like C-terminal domain-containing protein [candidate division Zixibacteria bacterium]